MRLLLGDCLDKLKELDDNSVDSIVTDPPYGLSFMGKKWDYDVPSQAVWEECMRVLKPGGHILSFAGSRTYHRMAVRIEDAGFEIRDQIMWIYGSGFPKSHDVGKNIEKIKVGGKANLTQVGTKKGLVATNHNDKAKSSNPSGFSYRTNQKGYSEVATDRTQVNGEIPVYEITNDYKGWGTALKPAHEPIVMARKPIVGTVANNVLEYGVGGINIDGCRIGFRDEADKESAKPGSLNATGEHSMFGLKSGNELNDGGRFPANIIFECTCENPKVVADKYDIRAYNDYKNTFQSYEENDKDKGQYEIKDVETTKVIHTDPNCPCYILDEQSGITYSGPTNQKVKYGGGVFGGGNGKIYEANSGGASRFFYCPKASKSDRDEGLTTEEKKSRKWRDDKGMKLTGSGNPRNEMSKNIHPTVKPTELMKYLIRLVTPKGGVVLDPFMGSGSTGKAAVREGMEFIGIEREEEYYEIAKQRIENETNKRKFW
jgi:site-specific DNA-methyltransferase (adenine-specific)